MEQTYVLDFGWFGESIPVLTAGVTLSVKLMLMTSVAAFAVGLIAGQMRMSKSPFLWFPAAAYIDFFRATPILVQIVFFFFLLPLIFEVRTGALTAGFIALSLNYGAFFAEIFRAGVTAIGRGQREAAAAIGMTGLQAARRVIYPQALRQMLPPIGSMFVSLLKDTSLVAILGVPELMNTAQSLGALTFRNIEVLLVVSCIYFSMTYPMAILANWLHRHVRAYT